MLLNLKRDRLCERSTIIPHIIDICMQWQSTQIIAWNELLKQWISQITRSIFDFASLQSADAADEPVPTKSIISRSRATSQTNQKKRRNENTKMIEILLLCIFVHSPYVHFDFVVVLFNPSITWWISTCFSFFIFFHFLHLMLLLRCAAALHHIVNHWCLVCLWSCFGAVELVCWKCDRRFVNTVYITTTACRVQCVQCACIRTCHWWMDAFILMHTSSMGLVAIRKLNCIIE